MVDWKKKLSSRKLWVAAANFVAQLVIAFGGTADTSVQITALIMAAGGVVAYVFSEGWADASSAKSVDTKATDLLSNDVVPATAEDDKEEPVVEPATTAVTPAV